jgi:hypothetical protein
MSHFELPSNCIACGVPLLGSFTRHRADCPIRLDIAELFPGFPQPDPEDVPAEDEEPNLP